MTKKEILRKIIDNLLTEMQAYNFECNLLDQSFIRKNADSIFIYQFLIYDRTSIESGKKGFLIEPYVYIHIKEIEGYYKEITLNKELTKDVYFLTLGNSVANLKANPDGINRKRNESLELYIFEESHIASVANQLLSYFKNYAFLYFMGNSPIKRVDDLLNKNPLSYCVHMNNDLFRFIKGIIAAKLNSNPRTEELTHIYSNLLIERDMPLYCKEEMERLRAVLPMIGKELDA